MIPSRLSRHGLLLLSTIFVVAVLTAGCPGPGNRGWKVSNCVLVPEDAKGSTMKRCYRDRPLRPAFAVSTCPDAEKNGFLCYPPCREGFHGAGPLCWQNCPAGYTDDGLFCRRDAHIFINDNRKCHWLDKCGLTFDRGCTTCPEGYSNDGCTCRKDAHIFVKDSFSRGLGTPMSCGQGQERIGGLCYGRCPAGYLPDGIYCLATLETCIEVPVEQPPLAPLQNFCFTLSQPSNVDACTPWLIQADTEENAFKLAQCKCENCTVKKISCGDLERGCASPSPSPPVASPSPSSAESLSPSAGASPSPS
jgi:hypothetical protein